MSPDQAIDRILELSAEAQTKRREAAENSPTFHKLTGAVLAYGEALNLLTKLRKACNWKQRSSGTPVAAARLFLSYFKFISATPSTNRVALGRCSPAQTTTSRHSLPSWSGRGLENRKTEFLLTPRKLMRSVKTSTQHNWYDIYPPSEADLAAAYKGHQK